MTSNLNPSILIIDYYDSLINKVDIFTEQVLEEHSPSELVFNDENSNKPKPQLTSQIVIPNKIDHILTYSNDETSISDPYYQKYNITLDNEVKVNYELSTIHYYVNKMREEMIEELNKLKDETMGNYQRLKQSGEKLDYGS